MARLTFLPFLVLLAAATGATAHRELFQAGDDCASEGPSGWWPCCESKDGLPEDSTCPPPVCGELSTEFIAPCCASKGPASNDTSCTEGSSCSSEGPASWWSCCQEKEQEGQDDSSCPPPVCGDLASPADRNACCASKEPPNPVIMDSSCPSGPVMDCASEGPANYWPCCEEKMANGTEDASCPPPRCGVLQPEANIEACCNYKGGPANDTSCPEPEGELCSSRGPAEWWSCCQEKASEGTADESCPPNACGQLTNPDDFEACCASKGGYANDTSCPCATAGPEGYWTCCETKASAGAEDNTCPPPVCGDLTPDADFEACCASKGGYANDTSCPCATAGPEGYWTCCETKASSDVEDNTCPPPMCGDLTPEDDVDACCASKGGYANDTSCPCATAGPEGYWTCCETKAANETADDTCPPPECGALQPQENINACCISKGGYRNDTTCPPPCDTEGPEGWWACCERRFEDGIPDDTCPPPTCGVLRPESNVDDCCDYKGIFTSDDTCPLVVCYDYDSTMKTLTEIFVMTAEKMSSTDNATEVYAYGLDGMAQMANFIAGDSEEFNSTVVFTNYPIPEIPSFPPPDMD